MEFLAGEHARDQMEAREVTESMVNAVLEHPWMVEHSRDLVFKYHGVVRGKPIAVVVAFDAEPPFIITVMLDEGAGE